MELKNKPLSEEAQKKEASLLRQQINGYLISYFSHFVLALALIIFAAGLFLFIYPKYQEVAKSNQDARDNLEAEYQAKDSYLSKIGKLKKSYQPISEADRKKIEAMVPADSEITRLIPEIESIVIRNSAVLNSIHLEPVDSFSQPEASIETGVIPETPAGIFSGPLPQGVKLVRIAINLSSVNYQVLKNIIKTMENNLRLLDISEVNYSSADDKAGLIIYTYYF